MNQSSGAPLRLERFVPIRDVRKLIWRWLTPGDREAVKCAHNSRHRPYEGFLAHCLDNGYGELLLWWRCAWPQQQHYDILSIWRACGRAGSVEAIEWLGLKAEWRALGDRLAALEGAAPMGHLHVILHERRYAPVVGFDVKTVPGQLTLDLRWLMRHVALWGHRMWARAVAERNGRACHWLRLAKCPEVNIMWRNAAVDVRIMQWMHDNGCPRPADGGITVYREAALNRDLGALEWLHARGFAWDATVCREAADAGNLDALKWLRARGCPWDADTRMMAQHGGHVEMVRWCDANGAPQ